MAETPPNRRRPAARQARVHLRRNRNRPARSKDWTRQLRESPEQDIDAESRENVVAKGALSRKRTVVLPTERDRADRQRGVVVAMRGLIADVDDGRRVLPCTVRRMLRTRLIRQRHPVTTGDRVWFSMAGETEGVATEGVIEEVAPRTSELNRVSGRRVHAMAANIDQAIIVASAREPEPKPHLIDRFMVAALAGGMTPIICVNKIDLDQDGVGPALVGEYAALGYAAWCTSAIRGDNMDRFADALRDKSTVLAGQSGVGKSSLLNTVQPDLGLAVRDVIADTHKGRHVTTTARLLKLRMGGFVVDTPGIRSFGLSAVPLAELETHFVEFVDRLQDCRFPDCTHTHESDCAIKAAVQAGEILERRYESYVRMWQERGTI